MIDCKQLAGKVIQACTILEDGGDGPDFQIDFTDGTSFALSLRAKAVIEAKSLLNGVGEPQVLKDYTAFVPSR